MRIEAESSTKLELIVPPPTFEEFALGASVVFVLCAVLWYSALTTVNRFLFVAVPIFAAVLAWGRREIACTFDGARRVIHYRRGGVAGTKLDTHAEAYSFDSFDSIEMQRYTSRLADGFQLRLRLKSGRVLPLSGRSLGFQECTEAGQQLAAITGADVPLKAIE